MGRCGIILCTDLVFLVSIPQCGIFCDLQGLRLSLTLNVDYMVGSNVFSVCSFCEPFESMVVV